MDSSGEEVFAGAGFACDEDGAVGWGDAVGGVEGVGEGIGASDDDGLGGRFGALFAGAKACELGVGGGELALESCELLGEGVGGGVARLARR